MNSCREFEGKNIDAAIELACKKLNISKSSSYSLNSIKLFSFKYIGVFILSISFLTLTRLIFAINNFFLGFFLHTFDSYKSKSLR